MRNNVRKLRESRGWTRKSMAAIVRCSTKHILTIERGSVNPSIELLLRMRDAFACALDDIYPQSTTRARDEVHAAAH